MTKKQMTYEQAMARLEELVSGMERNEWGIDQLSDALKEAQELIQLCRDKLYKADKQVKKLLNEE
ncbi:MAG: exodeoxyribonuclease VII small subunit [Bacteroidaceae bacterium]|nr:exodeoxyribonuclease VII small subunit [Bacteroidaceae bacterium]